MKFEMSRFSSLVTSFFQTSAKILLTAARCSLKLPLTLYCLACLSFAISCVSGRLQNHVQPLFIDESTPQHTKRSNNVILSSVASMQERRFIIQSCA